MSLKVLKHDEWGLTRPSELMDGHDMRIVQFCQRPRLHLELFQYIFVTGIIFCQYLEQDFPVERLLRCYGDLHPPSFRNYVCNRVAVNPQSATP